MPTNKEHVEKYRKYIESIIDEVSRKQEVQPKPVLSRLDKIIELLETLVKKRGVTEKKYHK